MTATEFADDPAAYFADSPRTAHHLSREEQEGLQLAALQARFAAMRDRLPPLKALADAARIEQITRLEDAAALLFPHSFYKSYDEYSLAYGYFADLTAWMQKFTLNDLSGVAGRQFGSIDEWMDTIAGETQVYPFHSSGTMGRLSFYPRGKAERAGHLRTAKYIISEWAEPAGIEDPARHFAVIWPSYASGRSALLRSAEILAKSVTSAPEHFHAMFPGTHSADSQYYVMRSNNARAQDRPPPPPNDYVAQILADSEAMMARHEEFMQAQLDAIAGGLHGLPAVLLGGPISIHKLAQAGLARGMASVFAPGSIVRSAGGYKGQIQPPRLEADIQRFTGVERMFASYGMTELVVSNFECREGRFHVQPWMIPYVLDEKSGAPLPRHGVQRGRAAFVDLMAQTYWGGVVSADRAELSWEPCACGRLTPHFGPRIDRIPLADADDHAIGAASQDAIHAALMALR